MQTWKQLIHFTVLCDAQSWKGKLEFDPDIFHSGTQFLAMQQDGGDTCQKKLLVHYL